MTLSRSLIMLLARLWTTAIVVVSFLPSSAKEVAGTLTNSHLPSVQHQAAVRHVSGHLLAFGVASLLFTIASARRIHRLYHFFMIAALALMIEYFEYVIYGPTFEWWDVRDDWFAAVVGCLVGLLSAPWLRVTDNVTD